MAAVVDNVPALPRFHAWQHNLDQSQGSKEVHFKQFLGHIDWDTFYYAKQSHPSIVNCWAFKTCSYNIYRPSCTSHYLFARLVSSMWISAGLPSILSRKFTRALSWTLYRLWWRWMICQMTFNSATLIACWWQCFIFFHSEVECKLDSDLTHLWLDKY